MANGPVKKAGTGNLAISRKRLPLVRLEAPAQCVVEPPTAFTIQAGSPLKSLATRQLPKLVRLSSHEIWPKLPHSSF